MNTISKTIYGIALAVPISAMAEVIIGPDVTRTTQIIQSSGDITRILDNVTVNTSGTNQHAILATNGSIILQGTNIDVITSNVTTNWAYGIYALPNAGASVSITTSGVAPTITTKGIASYAVIAIGRNFNGLESFNLNGISLYTEGLSSAAVMLNNAIGVIENAYIQTTGGRITGSIVGSYGMNPQENATLYAKNVRIDNTGDNGGGGFTTGTLIADRLNISTRGYSAYGWNTQDTGKTTINNSTIQTYGDVSHAIRLSGTGVNTPLFSGENLVLATQGYSASGVVAFTNSQANITNASIKTFNNASSGLYAYQPGAIINAAQVGIETQGTGSYGAIANIGGRLSIANSNILTNGANAPGLYVFGNNMDPTTTTATAVNTLIETTGSESAALTIRNGGTLSLAGVNAKATGLNSQGLLLGPVADFTNIFSAQNSSIISVQDAGIKVTGGIGQINLNNSLVQGSSHWLVVGEAVTPTPIPIIIEDPGEDQGSGTHVIPDVNETLQNNTLLFATPTTANIIANNSTLIGGAFTATDALSNVELTNKSTWNMTVSSNVSALVNSASAIYFAAPLSSIYKSLTVDNYVGVNGLIQLNTFLEADDSPSDKLVINSGSATGTTGLAIVNTLGDGALTTGNGILIVDALNNGTTATDAFHLTNYVAAGPYQYELYRSSIDESAPENWYLRSRLREVEPNYRPEVSLYAAMPSIELNFNRALLGTFHQRVGAEEQVIGKQKDTRAYLNGAWVRFINRGGSVDNKGILNQGPKFDFHIYAGEFGVDVYHNEYDNHHRDFAGFYVGGGSNSSSVTHYDQRWAGKADFKSTTLGLYWTHIGANDWYIDGVLQANLFDHDVGSAAMQLNHLRNEAYAASIEAGYPFALSKSWSIEPEAQLIYQRLPSSKAEDLAARIHFNATDSFITRAAARVVLDQEVQKTHIKRVTSWVTPSYWYDAKATSTTQFSSANGWVPFQSTLRGSWFGVDVGSTVQFNEVFSLYGTVSGDTTFNGRGRAYNALAGLRVNLK